MTARPLEQAALLMQKAPEDRHDLRELMDLLADAGRALPDDPQDIDVLTPYGALLRYEATRPPSSLDRPAALEYVRRVRRSVEPQVPGAASE